jgi:hypothetical protein
VEGIVRRNRTRAGLFACSALALAAMLPAQAATLLPLKSAYVFYDWDTPTTAVTAPFSFTGADGYQMTLDGSGVATGLTAVNDFAFPVFEALTYSSHTGNTSTTRAIDAGESLSGATLANYVNSEIGQLDDVGIRQEGTDARLNLDFTTSSAAVWFNLPNTSVYGLMIAEDAGLDGFRLSITPTTRSTVGEKIIFDGFTSTVVNQLVASNHFSLSDSNDASKMDQIFVFLFAEPITGGFARVGNSRNYGGESLEIDMIATVPLPTAFWLFGSALVGFVALSRRRS